MDLIFIEEAFERLLLDYDRGELWPLVFPGSWERKLIGGYLLLGLQSSRQWVFRHAVSTCK